MKQDATCQFNLIKDWRLRRKEQGYCYKQVLSEIRRRAHGEYILSKEDASNALQNGELMLEVRFKVSALLSDFFKTERVSIEMQHVLFGLDSKDNLDTLLDPFPLLGSQIENDPLVDSVYPAVYNKILIRE